MKRSNPYITIDRGGYIRFIGSNKLLGKVARNGTTWEARTLPGRIDSMCHLFAVRTGKTRHDAVESLMRDMCEATNQQWRLEDML